MLFSLPALLILSAIILLIWGISKKWETSIWLTIVAVSLLYTAYYTNIIIEDPALIIVQSVKKSFSDIALTIMFLFGYSHYMQQINASESLVKIASKPLMRIKYPYLLMMALFLLASFLSVVITSAAALAILLLSTFYPILKNVGISKYSTAAIIVSAAGIMPSPLAVETYLSAQALDLSISQYMKLSYSMTLPMLIGMTLFHGWWQWRSDQSLAIATKEKEAPLSIKIKDIIYAPLPFLPLILFILYAIFFPTKETDIISILLISLAIALLVDTLYHKNFHLSSHALSSFWQGMGQGLIQVGSIVITAGLFVQALKEVGLITLFYEFVSHNTWGAFSLIMILMLSIIVIGMTSGSGLALYFGLAPLVPTFAMITSLEGWKISTLLEVTAHTSRTFSALAAVMIVVSKQLDILIVDVIKRTWLPVVGAWLILLFQLFFM